MREVVLLDDLSSPSPVLVNEEAIPVQEVESDDELKRREYYTKKLDNYVYVDDFKAALEVAYNTGMNIIFHGTGGHAKSELTLDFLRSKGIDPYVMALGSGTNTDRIFGGTDLRHFIGESADGRLEFLVENSFMNHEVVIFEELFDAPAFILEQLKDILSSKVFRNGSQIFPIKTKLIICNTNKTRSEFAKSDVSIKALLERFPLDCEVKWTDYNAITYSNLLTKTLGFADPLLVKILEDFAKSGKIISPRIAINAAKLLAECGPSCLKFIAEFNEDKKLLQDAISNYELTEKFVKLQNEILTNIVAKMKQFNIEKDSSNIEVFKTLNDLLGKKIKELEKLKVGDDLVTKRKSCVDELTLLYNTSANSIKVIKQVDNAMSEKLDDISEELDF